MSEAWNSVLDNASHQDSCAQQRTSSNIEDFYPELHKSPVNGLFTNTIGSHLLGDVVGSPCVVVDIYDWNSPDDLIRVYGVDQDFLMKLRDHRHVILSANLSLERYERCTWLHPILGDKRTVFRSLRTPAFFQSRMPSMAVERTELRNRLLVYLDKLAPRDIQKFCRLTHAAHLPKSAEELANLLAIWATYVHALEPESALDVANGLAQEPQDLILSLRQWHLLAVTPYSGALGGYARVERTKILSYFPSTLKKNEVSDLEFVRLQNLNEYLSRIVLNTTASDLTSEQYWRSMTAYERDRLLDKIEDRTDREEALRAEATLRSYILRAGGEDWDYRDIDAYVSKLTKRVEKWDNVTDLGFITMAVLFILGQSKWAALARIIHEGQRAAVCRRA
jgi:hypothetical protein